MDRLSIIYDVVSGILVSIDIFSLSLGKIFGKWIEKRAPTLNDTVNPLKIRTFLFSLAFTFIPLFILVSYAMCKDIDSGIAFHWPSIFPYLLGIIFGVLVVTLVTGFILWRRKARRIKHGGRKYELDKPIYSTPTLAEDANMLGMIWAFFMFIWLFVPLFLLFAPNIDGFWMGVLLMSILTVWIFPTAMLLNRSLVKYITEKTGDNYYGLARIGLIIFILSHLVHFIFI